MNRRLHRTAAATAVLCLAASSSALRAEDEKPIVIPIENRIEKRVVVRDDDSEPQVFVWSGKDGEKIPGDGELIQLGRGYLGVQLIEMTDELRKHWGADEKSGVLVGRVEEDSPAAKAGVRVGDIITSVDGESVAWSGEVGRQVRRKKQGDVVRLEVIRDGRGQTLNVEVAERDPMRAVLRRVDLGGLPGIEAELAPLGPAMERALEVVEDPAVNEKLRSLSKLREVRAQGLEQRMKELENRIRELEKELEEKNRR